MMTGSECSQGCVSLCWCTEQWMGRNLEDKFSSGLEEVLDTVRAVEVKVGQ